jgi:hypothetical protein
MNFPVCMKINTQKCMNEPEKLSVFFIHVNETLEKVSKMLCTKSSTYLDKLNLIMVVF